MWGPVVEALVSTAALIDGVLIGSSLNFVGLGNGSVSGSQKYLSDYTTHPREIEHRWMVIEMNLEVVARKCGLGCALVARTDQLIHPRFLNGLPIELWG